MYGKIIMSAVVLKQCAGLGKTVFLDRKYRSKGLWRLLPNTAFKSSVSGGISVTSGIMEMTTHMQPQNTLLARRSETTTAIARIQETQIHFPVDCM